jgi:hypothetical protein
MSVKIKQFDKPLLKSIRTQLDKKLEELGKEFGITIKAGNFSYSSNTVSMKLEGTIDGKLTRDQQAIETYSKLLTGRELKYGSVVGAYKVVAFKTRSSKLPWIVENAKGEYKVSTEQLNIYFNNC